MQPTLVLIVSTSAAPSKEDDDEDHSVSAQRVALQTGGRGRGTGSRIKLQCARPASQLLYTYCDLPQAPGARVLKALTLAAKGAVASICGEKVRLVHCPFCKLKQFAQGVRFVCAPVPVLQVRSLQVEHHGCNFTLSILHLKVLHPCVRAPKVTRLFAGPYPTR